MERLETCCALLSCIQSLFAKCIYRPNQMHTHNIFNLNEFIERTNEPTNEKILRIQTTCTHFFFFQNSSVHKMLRIAKYTLAILFIAIKRNSYFSVHHSANLKNFRNEKKLTTTIFRVKNRREEKSLSRRSDVKQDLCAILLNEKKKLKRI